MDLVHRDSQEIIPADRLPVTKEQAVTLLKASPMQYWASIRPKTFEDVFKAQETCGLSIKTIEIEMGETYIRALMVKWMKQFVDFYSTNGTMDNYQIADTIELIRDEYPHFTQEDFKLFFTQAKKGYFDSTVYRIDGAVIMSWIRKYNSSRCTAAESMAIKESERFKDRVYLDQMGSLIPEHVAKSLFGESRR